MKSKRTNPFQTNDMPTLTRSNKYMFIIEVAIALDRLQNADRYTHRLVGVALPPAMEVANPQ